MLGESLAQCSFRVTLSDMIRSPLLWSGSKYALLSDILPRIKGRLWEPFCGSAVVSLNYEGESVISDRNVHLMNFWSQCKRGYLHPDPARTPIDTNSYYVIRNVFNKLSRCYSTRRSRVRWTPTSVKS